MAHLFARRSVEGFIASVLVFEMSTTLSDDSVLYLHASKLAYKGKFSYSAVSNPRSAQCALHFTTLTDLFTQTPYRLLWEASSHMLQLMREGCSYTYPPLPIVRYSFIQLSELEQYRVKQFAKLCRSLYP